MFEDPLDRRHGPHRAVVAKKVEKPAKDATPKPAGPPPGPHDSLPFDAAYFRSHFPHFIRKPSKRPRPASRDGRDYAVNVVLGDGAVSLDVSHIEGMSDQWALFAVFDDDGAADSGATRYLFVPYGTIARIEVTALERHAGSIGFRVRGRDAKKQKAKKGKAARAARAARTGRNGKRRR